jgi:hypothetical protein
MFISSPSQPLSFISSHEFENGIDESEYLNINI